MEENLLDSFAPFLKQLNEPLFLNRELKLKLSKIQEDNQKHQELLRYYQTALEKGRKAYKLEQASYDSQITTLRNLSENYEKQIKLSAQEKSQITDHRDQVQLISTEIAILKDKLEILKKNQAINQQIKTSSKLTSLKHQAFKLQEKLKQHKFS